MSAFEILVAVYLAVVPPALCALFLRRFDRTDQRLDELSRAVARCTTREEMAALRSDVTQVALAVGARSRASEG